MIPSFVPTAGNHLVLAIILAEHVQEKGQNISDRTPSQRYPVELNFHKCLQEETMSWTPAPKALTYPFSFPPFHPVQLLEPLTVIPCNLLQRRR